MQANNWTFDTARASNGTYGLKFKTFQAALDSKNVDYTISKVRIAVKDGKSFIVASSYEGTILGLRFEGKKIWENKLSAFMNHDI